MRFLLAVIVRAFVILYHIIYQRVKKRCNDLFTSSSVPEWNEPHVTSRDRSIPISDVRSVTHINQQLPGTQHHCEVVTVSVLCRGPCDPVPLDSESEVTATTL